MVRNAKLVGQSIISYLQKKGYPEVSGFLSFFAHCCTLKLPKYGQQMDRVKCSHYRYVLIIVCNAQNCLPRERSLYYGVVQEEGLDCFHQCDLSFLIHIQLHFMVL